MSQINLLLSLDVPQHRSEKRKFSIEDEVREALDLIESGNDSHVEWNMIRRLYREICKRKPTARIANLKEMIEPVLSKYGYHKVV